MDSTQSPSPAAKRGELRRQYKEAHPPMGVYAIRNLATGRSHVFASMDVAAAMNRVRFELRMKQHRGAQLQREWLQQGPDSFRFEVLDLVKKREDPAFDYRAEVDALLALWREELRA